MTMKNVANKDKSSASSSKAFLDALRRFGDWLLAFLLILCVYTERSHTFADSTEYLEPRSSHTTFQQYIYTAHWSLSWTGSFEGSLTSGEAKGWRGTKIWPIIVCNATFVCLLLISAVDVHSVFLLLPSGTNYPPLSGSPTHWTHLNIGLKCTLPL